MTLLRGGGGGVDDAEGVGIDLVLARGATAPTSVEGCFLGLPVFLEPMPDDILSFTFILMPSLMICFVIFSILCWIGGFSSVEEGGVWLFNEL